MGKKATLQEVYSASGLTSKADIDGLFGVSDPRARLSLSLHHRCGGPGIAVTQQYQKKDGTGKPTPNKSVPVARVLLLPICDAHIVQVCIVARQLRPRRGACADITPTPCSLPSSHHPQSISTAQFKKEQLRARAW
jgi:hypothetical protein